MDKTIINNWNATVKPIDIIFHLGDVFFCNTARQFEIMEQLNGKKILIKGNHDKATDTKYRRLGFDEVYDKYELGDYILTHRPMSDVPNDKVNIHGHVHSKVDNWLDQYHICVSVEMTNYIPVVLENIWL